MKRSYKAIRLVTLVTAALALASVAIGQAATLIDRDFEVTQSNKDAFGQSLKTDPLIQLSGEPPARSVSVGILADGYGATEIYGAIVHVNLRDYKSIDFMKIKLLSNEEEARKSIAEKPTYRWESNGYVVTIKITKLEFGKRDYLEPGGAVHNLPTCERVFGHITVEKE